jgi:G3E family GTPase
MSEPPADEMSRDSRVPVNIISGFLGSGKTSLLQRVLSDPFFANTAVLINELGEIGLDHQLLDYVDEETVVLKNGCICCSMREDLQRELLGLDEKRGRGLLPEFTRVMIETTGLADPAPVLNTIMLDRILRHHFRVGVVVTTVDAVHGLGQLARHPESIKQAAVADRLIITKADLVEEAALERLRAVLQEINASALVIVSRNDIGADDVLLDQDAASEHCAAEVVQWLPGRRATGQAADRPPLASLTSAGKRLGAIHGSRVRTVGLSIEQPLNWIAFGAWLSMLLHSRGGDILRVKGILNIEGSRYPTVIHGVQHLIHPPVHLRAWPTDDRRSQLIFIGDLPPKEMLQASLEVFNRRAKPGSG